MVERILGKDEVAGSIPAISSTKKILCEITCRGFFLCIIFCVVLTLWKEKISGTVPAISSTKKILCEKIAGDFFYVSYFAVSLHCWKENIFGSIPANSSSLKNTFVGKPARVFFLLYVSLHCRKEKIALFSSGHQLQLKNPL